MKSIFFLSAISILVLLVVIFAAASAVSAVPLAAARRHRLQQLSSHHKNYNGSTDLIRTAFRQSTYLRPDTLTLSGISAGAIMATQVQMAWSSIVNTNLVVAGVPYYCSMGEMGEALSCMSYPQLIDLALLDTYVAVWESSGMIDSLSNLANHFVFMWSGTSDTVVAQGTMRKLVEQYQIFGLGASISVFNVSAEHAWISTNPKANECSYLGEPYVNNCNNYDLSSEYLSRSWRFMANTLNKPNVTWNSTRGAFRQSNLYVFSQAIYGASPDSNSLGTRGLVYVPRQCGAVSRISGSSTHSLALNNATARCHIHINFHGCTQQYDKIGTQYLSENGLNEWAESNNIVILYPQAAPNLFNPQACFAWWQFSPMVSDAFATKDGVQISMFYNMMTNLVNEGII